VVFYYSSKEKIARNILWVIEDKNRTRAGNGFFDFQK